MAKLIFRAEIPLPRTVILPLAVAREAESPRKVVITDRSTDMPQPIADHLQDRHPSWFEKDSSPDLESMTVKRLREYAAEKGIDLGKAERKEDIIQAIANPQPVNAQPTDESEADAEPQDEAKTPDA